MRSNSNDAMRLGNSIWLVFVLTVLAGVYYLFGVDPIEMIKAIFAMLATAVNAW